MKTPRSSPRTASAAGRRTSASAPKVSAQVGNLKILSPGVRESGGGDGGGGRYGARRLGAKDEIADGENPYAKRLSTARVTFGDTGESADAED